MRREALSAEQARRIALAAQGFAHPRPTGRVDVRHLRSVVDRLGLVQLDSVNVLVRAHEMPAFSRLGPYPRAILDELTYRRRELIECWAHQASLVPAAAWPTFRWTHEKVAARGRWRGVDGWARDHAPTISRVLSSIDERGPLAVGDVAEPDSAPGRQWWGWSPTKAALEWLFHTGRLGIANRRHFNRHYDLIERVVPRVILDAPIPSEEDARLGWLRMASRSLGIATVGDLADYYRQSVPDARPLLRELVAAGELTEVAVEGWREPGLLHPDAHLPRSVDALAVVSPFDPLVWHRPRIERLFGFHYRIELYVPQAQRTHGYYVLPLLMGDRLVARVDLKADRASGVLRVPGAWAEAEVDHADVADGLARELRSIGDWLGLERILVGRRGDLVLALRSALAQ